MCRFFPRLSISPRDFNLMCCFSPAGYLILTSCTCSQTFLYPPKEEEKHCRSKEIFSFRRLTAFGFLEMKSEKKFGEKFLSQITYVEKYKNFFLIGTLAFYVFRKHEKTLTRKRQRWKIWSRTKCYREELRLRMSL